MAGAIRQVRSLIAHGAQSLRTQKGRVAMPFNDESLTDLARTQSAIGALHVLMDTLSFTGDGIPTEAHYLLAELEQRERYYFKRELRGTIEQGS